MQKDMDTIQFESRREKKIILCIALFTIWVTISGILFAIGICENYFFLKIIGGLNMLIIILLILSKSTPKIKDEENCK